jgi:hypothetical protein
MEKRKEIKPHWNHHRFIRGGGVRDGGIKRKLNDWYLIEVFSLSIIESQINQ